MTSVPAVASSQQSTTAELKFPSSAALPAVTYWGEGVLPITERVEKRILNLEFIEMRELMPETWLSEDEYTCLYQSGEVAQ